MTQTRRNTVANFAGSGCTALLSVVLIPVYVRIMGIEAYGLVGVLNVLQGTLALLELGLGTTLSLELARLSVEENRAQEMRDTVFLLQLVYWMVAVVVAAVVMFGAPYIARQWLHPAQLKPQTVQEAVVVMGIVIGCRWPLGCYTGGLMGLGHQVLVSAVGVAVAGLQGLGGALVLWRISPTIGAYLTWMVATSGPAVL